MTGTRRQLRLAFRDYGTLIRIALPLTLSSLGMIATALVDTALLGRYSIAAVASVGIATQILFSLLIITIASAIGQAVLSAQAFGAGKPREVGGILLHSFALFGIVSFILSLALLFGGGTFVGLFSDDPEVIEGATRYLTVRGSILPLITFQYLLINIFASNKETKWALYLSLIVNGINVILSYPLIYGFWFIPELGVTGSALGGLIADIFGTLFIAFAFYRRGYWRWIRPESLRLRWSVFKTLLRVSVPTFISVSSLNIAAAVSLYAIGLLGTTTLATGRIALEQVFATFGLIYSFSEAGQIMAGRSIGAAKWKQAKRLYHRNRELLLMIFLPLMIFFFIFPEFAIRIYTNFDEIIENSANPVRIGVFITLVTTWTMNNVTFIRGVGRPKVDLISTIISNWLIHVPLIFIFSQLLGWGLEGVFWAELVFWVARGTMTQLFILRMFINPKHIPTRLASD